MVPRFSVHDHRDVGPGNSKNRRDLRLRNALMPKPSYFKNFKFFQLGESAKFSFWDLVLSRSVAHIVKLSSKVKMAWSDTKLVVLRRAVVKHLHAFGYRPAIQNPRNPVRQITLSGTRKSNHAVATDSAFSIPNPTVPGNDDFRPEAIQKVFRKPLRFQESFLIVRPLDQFHRFLIGSRSGRVNSPGQFCLYP